jgi:hypothetical protein
MMLRMEIRIGMRMRIGMEIRITINRDDSDRG